MTVVVSTHSFIFVTCITSWLYMSYEHPFKKCVTYNYSLDIKTVLCIGRLHPYTKIWGWKDSFIVFWKKSVMLTIRLCWALCEMHVSPVLGEQTAVSSFRCQLHHKPQPVTPGWTVQESSHQITMSYLIKVNEFNLFMNCFPADKDWSTHKNLVCAWIW